MKLKIWMGTYYRDLLLKELKFNLAGKKVLEVGCHDGHILSKIEAEEKVGLDLEPVHLYPEIDYIKADFLDHNFKDKKFDFVISIEVMEHVKNPRKFLQNMDKVMSNKGRALLSVPSKKIKIFPYLFQGYIHKKWGHNYRRGYSVKELHCLLGENLNGRNYKIISWHCPLWRTIYIPLKLMWKITPRLTQKILKCSIKIDAKFKKGKNGFFFIVVE